MTPDQCKSTYARMIDAVGEPILIRRYAGTGSNRPKFEVTVRARVTGFHETELVGLILQGDTKLIVLADDLVASQFAMPVRKGDKVVVRGKELNVEDPDGNTRRVQGVLIAYEIQARG